MAVVAEIRIGTAIVRMCDDCYRDKTPEENRRAKETSIKNVSRIVAEAIERGETRFQQSEQYPDYKAFRAANPPRFNVI